MRAKEIIGLIPDDLFEFLTLETGVDYQVKKLTGESVFKLILFSMLESNKLILRVMGSFLNSSRFQCFVQNDELSVKYNSIRDRICTINTDYFERLFQEIFQIYNRELQEEQSLSKSDSTYIAIASKLISIGMRNGRASDDKKFIKYSINLKGSLPSSFKVFTEQSAVSENVALSELIDQTDCITDSIVVFDRGLQSRKSYDKFTQDDKFFVIRTNPNVRFELVENREIPPVRECNTVLITSDSAGYLFGRKNAKTQYKYRIIKAKIIASGEEIVFISNLLEEDAYFIAELYKQRWEIELFFKFIKQHLNVSHLVSRTENGIKVMLYVTMILAMLIIVYKKKNNIKSFKIAKLKFSIELENEIIREIVLLCDGKPEKVAHLFGYD
jgi:hypothetical protein